MRPPRPPGKAQHHHSTSRRLERSGALELVRQETARLEPVLKADERKLRLRQRLHDFHAPPGRLS